VPFYVFATKAQPIMLALQLKDNWQNHIIKSGNKNAMIHFHLKYWITLIEVNSNYESS
jgi:hypothetical protein